MRTAPRLVRLGHHSTRHGLLVGFARHPPEALASERLSESVTPVAPPTPDWGAILEQGKNFILTAWWMSLWPGLFLLASAFAVMVLGRTLQQRFDRR